MLADPQWANKSRAGRRDLIRPCTSCNWCISPHPGRVQVGCAENPRTGTELDPPIPDSMGAGRRAVVIGAGPGGASAALLLQQSGFETHLYESRAFVGGGIVASAMPPGKDKLFWYSDYLGQRVAESGIIGHFGARADCEAIVALAPDVVILAAGTRRIDLPIEGIADAMVLDAYDLLMRETMLDLAEGQHAVVYGGGETGCETAEYCAEQGITVTLVTRSGADKLARSADWVYRMGLVRRLAANPLVTILADSHVRAVGNGKITIETGGEFRELAADRLLLAQGRRSDDGLADTLRSKGIIVSVVGDSRQVGRIGDAVHMAYRAVQALAAQFGPPIQLAC
jgi:NADPH-dependent 2,4-dienoyl-CoA reductase/sulfur reductase-like enzyme